MAQPSLLSEPTESVLEPALSRARAVLQSSAVKLSLPSTPFDSGSEAPASVLSLAGASLGNEELARLLPNGGFALGQVHELSVGHPSYATSLSLTCCAIAQTERRQSSGQTPWCAFVDPFASLYAPGVEQAGVDLRRLLVVRPTLSTLARTALRLVEARAFALVVIDTCSPLAHAQSSRAAQGTQRVLLGKWVNVVRRLNLALSGTQSLVLLITDKTAERPVPLPVASRLELRCVERGKLEAKLSKERHGRLQPARSVTCRHFAPGVFMIPGEGEPAAGQLCERRSTAGQVRR